MILAAQALAFVRGRDYALPEDVRDLALDVLRHRLVLSYEALGRQRQRRRRPRRSVLAAIPLPEVPLHERRARSTTGMRAAAPADALSGSCAGSSGR